MKTIKLNTMRKLILSTALFAVSITTFAQVGVGTTDPKAGLDITSDKGMLLPRMADHTTLTPVDGTLDANEAGLQVYNTTTNTVMIWNGTAWSAASAKFVDGATATDAVFTGGNVGIGTTQPELGLEINTDDWSQLVLSDDNNNIKSYLIMSVNDVTTSTSSVTLDLNRSGSTGVFGNTGSTHSRIGMRALDSDSHIYFSTSSINNTHATERMRIDKDGKVGIGTSTPSALLDVSADVRINGLTIGIGGSSSSNSNTALGLSALSSNASGVSNTAIGSNALSNNTGNNNTALGSNALLNNTSGGVNVAVGYNSLSSNTTGANNVAVGANTLSTNLTGASNVAIGRNVLSANTTGNNNIGMGNFALSNSITSSNNIAIGSDALKNNTTGALNLSIGVQALKDNTTGTSNVGVGFSAIDKITTGNNNIGLGVSAGRLINNGGDNLTSLNSIYIGGDSRGSADGNVNEIVIGSSARGNGSNTITLGSTSITKVVTSGSLQIGNNSSACNSGMAGTIRFNGTNFQGCNGTTWVQLN